ncbi:MAG: nucleotidyltransferase domain-containing protein [Methanopyri archaeon]|jgi:predicted nucleotidyltransferase|nr:nucleotidyltransferase domain-containing protein [Methanopyri archaeon]
MNAEDEKVISTFVEEAKGMPGLQCILLFGSIARGDEDKRSDIDLLLIFDDPDPEGRYIGAVTEIVSRVEQERRIRPVLSNIVDYDIDFIDNAVREGKVLYGKLVLTSKRFPLAPYRLMRFTYTGLSQSERQSLYRALHGYTVKTRRNGKTYESKKEGLIDIPGVIKVGNAVLMVPEDKYRDIEKGANALGVDVTSRKVWFAR